MIQASAAPSTFEPVAIGKFAKHAEYLRAPAGELLGSFDSWLNEGFDLAHERFGTAWQGMFQMGIPHGFLWRFGESVSTDCFCGVVAPSQDSVGRHYPLAVGARLSHALFARTPHAAPLALGQFLDGAYATISEARAGLLSRAELGERLQSTLAPSEETFARAESDYAAWCRATPAAFGWSGLFPGPDPLNAARSAIEHLAAAGARARADGAALAARLPVGPTPAGATALWLDVLRHVWGASAISSALWAVYDGALFVAAGTPAPDLVGCLWMRGALLPTMLDLTDGSHAPPPSSAAPLSGEPALTMHAFLGTLAR